MLNNLIGRKFGRLIVVDMAPRTQKKTFWICRCDCGQISIVRSDALLEGKTISCGCLKKEQDKINLVKAHKHKMSGTRLYRIWQDMKKRCCNPHVHRYERYGGRGIQVCEVWVNDFRPFMQWALANGYADNLMIDRIDNDGDYEPSNCRWIKNKSQCNNRQSCIMITARGKTQSLMAWCEELGLSYSMVKSRYQRGQPYLHLLEAG